MLSAGFEPADVYLGEAEAGLRRRRGDDIVTTWIADKSPVDCWHAVLGLLSDGGARQRASLWISGSLARPFLYEPIVGLRNAAEASDVASSLVLEATGLEGPCVAWLNDWRPGTTCVAVAMSLALRDEVERSAKKSRVRLTGFRPWWAGVLDATSGTHANGFATLAIQDTDSLTLLSGPDDITDALSYVPVPSAVEMEGVLGRHSLATGITRQEIVRVRLSQLEEAKGSLEGGARGTVPFASYEPSRT